MMNVKIQKLEVQLYKTQICEKDGKWNFNKPSIFR